VYIDESPWEEKRQLSEIVRNVLYRFQCTKYLVVGAPIKMQKRYRNIFSYMSWWNHNVYSFRFLSYFLI